jgi:hypothetical protein
MEKNGVKNGKDRRVRADAQGERNHRYQSEGRILEQ